MKTKRTEFKTKGYESNLKENNKKWKKMHEIETKFDFASRYAQRRERILTLPFSARQKMISHFQQKKKIKIALAAKLVRKIKIKLSPKVNSQSYEEKKNKMRAGEVNSQKIKNKKMTKKS